MKKKVCFFSRGFAFNRLVRMQFYEKTFPREVDMYLIVSDKYEKQPEKKWPLTRTKVVNIGYEPIKFPFKLRKFCRENEIDRMITVGSSFGGFFLLFATLLREVDYVENLFTHVFYRFELQKKYLDKIKTFLDLFVYYPLFFFAQKATFTEKGLERKARRVFLVSKRKTRYLPAPVNEKRFRPSSKRLARKKLKLPLNENIVIHVGRVNSSKGSEILRKLIKLRKDIFFVVVGEINDSDFPKSAKNLIHLDKIENRNLPDYYNASDFSFCINQGGGGLGIATQEALSCGVPCVILKKWEIKNTISLFKTEESLEEVNSVLSKFFNMSLVEREKISKEARQFILENYSYSALGKKYIEAYLT
jgi:glycosyltransferase involved in cell wall biosynthesis